MVYQKRRNPNTLIENQSNSTPETQNFGSRKLMQARIKYEAPFNRNTNSIKVAPKQINFAANVADYKSGIAKYNQWVQNEEKLVS